MKRGGRTTALLAIVGLALTGCASDSGAQEPTTPASQGIDAEQSTAAPQPTDAEPVEPEIPVAPPAQPVPEFCLELTLEIGAVLHGEDLTTCILTAQATAETGRMVTSDGGDDVWSTFDFDMVPELTAYSPESQAGFAYVLTPEGDWINVRGTGWTQTTGDPTWAGLTDTARIMSHRIYLTWMEDTDWEVRTYAEVPTDGDPFVTAGWRLAPEGGTGPVNEVWLDSSFLPIYVHEPGRVRLRTVFQDWGGPVEFPAVS
ncbi:hypothetical protein Bcav_1478 [Beutenbergia cavernae DSM 12333]|uniref:Lipoprotein n=1 Tax=Beutenbergia cavernae (strain ATCC BAA-8 / DSM 12333 / CCUG 43141 / JCM 11478 / NBRC 16432 / NCIMB 13614 / HKI 0122) TaxID=471853 RepID=C5C2P8_BEUC1|nr:hypothetical protein [Beutenbergia cavernae]ACQ79734.1 hypothetical protein Bcav_1478 [Beutenbergia cavernae DSM 12333]